MKPYEFGQVVLLKFPFTDGVSVKKRPALVVRVTGDGDLIVVRITSKIYRSEFDVELPEWENCGLLLPSIIRTHKIATLSTSLVHQIMGTIPVSIQTEVASRLDKLVKRAS